jgi:receptor expression-enhancing protein 5/6
MQDEQNQNTNQSQIMQIINREAGILEKKIGIPAKFIIIILGICIASVVIGYLDQYIVCFLAVVFPTISSIRAIESPEEDDDKQWLTYWVVYACFTFIDLFVGFLLKFIPFYFILKMIFILWLSLPNFNGALKIYNNFVIKIFKKYENDIKNIEGKADNFIKNNMANMQGRPRASNAADINLSSNLPN